MKKKIFALAIVAILILVGTISVNAGNSQTGNGAMSGKHYTLNLLGKNWDRNENPSEINSNGHRIFVKLGSKNGMMKTKILLEESTVDDHFEVLDCDGTDGEAKFMLPRPYEETDTEFENPAYKVYIRVLSPRGNANMYTTAFDGTLWLESEEVVELVGGKGKKTFDDVTKELTTILVDITDDDIDNPVRYGLFDDIFEQYAWDYDNYGLKHVQMRFYPI
jgi:hypothetical protein